MISNHPPETFSAVLGEFSSRSWVTVSLQYDPSPWGSISQVTRLSGSTANSESYKLLQVCEYRHGGSHSSTVLSPHTSAPSGERLTTRLPGSKVDSMLDPWKYSRRNSVLVMASQICSGGALIKIW